MVGVLQDMRRRCAGDNYMEGNGSLLAKKEKEEEVKQAQKKAKPAVEPKANTAPRAPTASVAGAGSPGKRNKKAIKEEAKARTADDFLRNKPSPGAAIRDVIGTVSSGVIPRDTGKVITKPFKRQMARRGRERRCGGEGMLRRGGWKQ